MCARLAIYWLDHTRTLLLAQFGSIRWMPPFLMPCVVLNLCVIAIQGHAGEGFFDMVHEELERQFDEVELVSYWC